VIETEAQIPQPTTMVRKQGNGHFCGGFHV